MAKEKHHLKLTTKGIIIIVVFVVALIIGSYLFAGYMYTGSRADGYVNSEGHCVGAGAVCADKEKPERRTGGTRNKPPARRIPTPTSRP